MSGTMFPKDVESGIQWRVRHRAPHSPDKEIVRVVTEAQSQALETRLRAVGLEPVVEARLITVGEWTAEVAELEAKLTAEEPDDDDD